MVHSEPTLFVVDDDEAVRESMAALASALGMNCEPFASAEEFLAAFEESWSGCAVVDLRLAGMDGTQLQERLALRGAALPVILVSAFATVPVAVKAMKNGAVSVVEKPLRPERLVNEIRTAMEVGRRMREAQRRRADLQARFEALDTREQDAMSMILDGLPNKTIARRLNVCERTVARIRADVFAKMGAGSAMELAQIAARLGFDQAAQVLHA